MRWFKRKPKVAVLKGLGDELVLMHKGVPTSTFVLTGLTSSLNDGVQLQFTEKHVFLTRHRI